MHTILSTRIILQARKAALSTEERPIEGIPLSEFNFSTEGTEATEMTATSTGADRGETPYQTDAASHSKQIVNV